MVKIILILCFFCVNFLTLAFSQNEIEIDSQVISINPDKEYIIIKAGKINGVEIGDGLVVHREGEKIAEAQIVEVRQEVSAAEILNGEKEIREGDGILIVKESKNPIAVKKEKTFEKTKRSKWTPILGSSAKLSSSAPVATVTSGSGINAEALKSDRISFPQGGSAKAIINTDFGTVFSYSLMVLRENGYSVIFSSRVEGAILATRPIELSLLKELWADATARIEHRVVVSLEIKNNEGSTEINAAGFKEHTQKGKQVKFPIQKESKYYSDLIELVSKIRERAEH